MRERQQLERAVRRRTSTLIVGPIGVGKTQLMRSVAERAARDGWRVMDVRATRGLANVPLGALTSLLPPGHTPATPADLVLDLTALVGRLGTEAAGVLVSVDDLPHLDDQSSGLLHQLVLADLAVIVATARVGDVLPDGARELVARQALDRLVLSALSRAETHRLAETVAGRRLGAPVLDAVWRTTDGNPLFVTAVVQDALERDALGDADSLVGGGLSPSVADAVRTRLGRLGEPEKTLLARLALSGSLSYARLDGDDLVAADRLEARGLVVTGLDGSRTVVRLVHPLFGEAVAEGLSHARRAELRAAEAGETVARGMRRRGDALRVAIALEEAGVELPDRIAVAAAEQANASGALPTALRLAQRAYAATPSLRAGILLAYTALHGSTPTDVQRLTDELDALAVSMDDRALLASTLAIVAMHDNGNLDGADAILSRRGPTITGPWRHEITAAAIGVRMYRGRLREAVALLDGVLGAGDAHPRSIVTATVGGQNALYLSGRAPDAAQLIGALTANRDSFDVSVPTLRVQLQLGRAEALAWAGEAEASRALLDELRREVPPASQPSSTAVIVSIVRGLVDVLDGHLAGTIDHLDRPHDVAASIYRPWFTYLFSRAATTAARLGDAGLAERLLDAAVAPSASWRLHVPTRDRAVAECLLLAGDEAAALAALRTVHLEAADAGDVSEELASALRLAAVLGDDLGDHAAAAAARFAGRYGGAVARALDAIGAGRAHDAATAVADVAACRHRMAAADLAELGTRRFGPAWTGPHPADLLAPGDRGPRTPPGAGGLTDRERQVAVLLSRGASDAAVATELGISLRTVHAHVRSIYRKLAISSRRDVAEALERA